MKIKAFAPRKKDLRDSCRGLELVAQDEHEEELLSRLYAVLRDAYESGGSEKYASLCRLLSVDAPDSEPLEEADE